MEGQDIAVYEGIRHAPISLKEVLQIVFRHRRLILTLFFATLVGAMVAILLFGIKYKAETTILVRNDRQDDIISTDTNAPRLPQEDLAREREINTAVAMLKSQDLLEQVVQSSHLLSSANRPWSRWLHPWETPGNRLARAARTLAGQLDIAPIPDSNLVRVTYTSRHPAQAALVLKNLDRLYIAKHVAVNRPPDVVSFFTTQTQHYKNELAQAEKNLAAFDRSQNAASPDLERDIELRKESEFHGEFDEAEAEIAQTARRNQELKAELAQTPQRLTTARTLSGNPQLMANLKSTLQTLENQRAVLLTNYQPTYRPVQEVEKQIAQVQATIAASGKNPIQQTTTDLNPTYEMLQSNLATSEANLSSLKRKAAALAPIAQGYGKAALVSDTEGIERQNLTQALKADTQNYLLYLNKREQARISEAMDNQRIVNVAIAEVPTVPSLPTNSPLMLLVAGAILAGMLSIGAAFVADYADPSFRTPDEVVRYLNVPVLAALPLNGGVARFALSPVNPVDPFATPMRKSGKRSFPFRHRRNGHGE